MDIPAPATQTKTAQMMRRTIPPGLTTRKINVGAGEGWYRENWEVLDNGPGDYSPWWRHRAKCWDTGLPSHAYETVFSSHTLEHVPHFRTEMTVAELNRIMKNGGTLRILVPDLMRAAKAYVEGDVAFFARSRHYTDHLGIGGSFMSKLISPGGQTLAITREMDELLGGYAHLYHFDFEMMRILLEKWGFAEVREMPYGESRDPEMNELLHVERGGKAYAMEDPFIFNKGHLESGEEWLLTGFDKAPKVSLIVEATKVRDEPYAYDKEYAFFRRARFDSRLDQLKVTIIRYVFRAVDASYDTARRSRLLSLLRLFRH